MAKPIPNPAQIAAIEADVANKTTQQQALVDTAALQDDVIIEKQKIDAAFKDLFDYYNTDIIYKYDDERKAINGTFVTNPVTEADILAVGANPPSGRLVPTPPAVDIVRIAEFDAGGYDGLTQLNEIQHIADQAIQEDVLENGITGSSPTVTATSQTASALTSASTTLDMTDATGPMSFSIGDVFVVKGITESAIVEVTGVTDNLGGDPPYDFTLDIELLVPPTGTIAIGADVDDSFTGFTNAERTSKTTTDPQMQSIMDALIVNLETELTNRQARLAEMLTALGLNDDTDGAAQITTATTNANTADAFITNYLLTTDISDTGLASLSTERGTRSTELSGRLAEILANYTGQTEDYYESRYQTSNNRGNVQRGTLRELENAKSVKTDMLAMAAGLQASIDSLNGILP